MKKFLIHRDMLQRGFLQEFTAETEGKVIVVSHQWLSYSHPDPDQEHFHTLKRVLDRLHNGEVNRRRLQNFKRSASKRQGGRLLASHDDVSLSRHHCSCSLAEAACLRLLRSGRMTSNTPTLGPKSLSRQLYTVNLS